MKTSLLLTCLLILCYGCRKEDHAQTYPTGEYESGADIKNDAVVLYTKDNTITDAGFIQAYLNRNQIYGLFNLAEENIPSPVHITFDNRVADSGYFKATSDNQMLEIIFNRMYNDSGAVVFVGRDSLQVPPSVDGELTCSNVGTYIRRHPMLTYCTQIPLGQSVGLLCKAQYQIPMTMDGADLSLPVISYHFAFNTSNSFCNMSERFAFGQFNKNVLKTIHTEDTLVVQTRTLTLERK